MHSIYSLTYSCILPISLDMTQLWWKRKITCIYNQGCIDIWYNFPKTACTIDTTWSSICLSRWDLIKHNNVMILQYLFTYESGSYCWTGQFNLAISFFFSKKKMDQHTILGRIGEGAHGIVLKAKHIEVFSSDLC